MNTSEIPKQTLFDHIKFFNEIKELEEEIKVLEAKYNKSKTYENAIVLQNRKLKRAILLKTLRDSYKIVSTTNTT